MVASCSPARSSSAVATSGRASTPSASVPRRSATSAGTLRSAPTPERHDPGHRVADRAARRRPLSRGRSDMLNFAQVGNDLYTGKRSIDFIGRQKTWYALSAVLIVLALVGIFARGLNFGIEFRGGSEFRISGVSDTSSYEDRRPDAVCQAGIGGNIVSTVIGSNTVRVQTEAAGDQNDAAKAAAGRRRSASARATSAPRSSAQLGPVGQPAGDPGADRLPHPRDARHGALLPNVEDGRRRPRRPAARPRHHGRDLLPVRVRDHAVVDDRLPHDPRVLALRHRRRLRQGPREHRGGVPHAADDLHRRPPTSPSTRPWSGPSTRPSSRCCRSPPSSSSASRCSARAPCSTSAWRCSSVSPSAPTRRSSSRRRCSSTCAVARRRSRSSTRRRCATRPASRPTSG